MVGLVWILSRGMQNLACFWATLTQLDLSCMAVVTEFCICRNQNLIFYRLSALQATFWKLVKALPAGVSAERDSVEYETY